MSRRLLIAALGSAALLIGGCGGDEAAPGSGSSDAHTAQDAGGSTQDARAPGRADGGQPRADAGPCVPQPEICNGLDDDCDGRIDNDIAGTGLPCGPDEGLCVQGTLQCRQGQLTCVGGVRPVPELCDGLDNNCDGQIDESFPENTEVCGPCGGLWQCRAGVLVCDDRVNAQGECEAPPQAPCEGLRDELGVGVGGPCTAQGQCGVGLYGCVEGALVCQGLGQPQPEICNGIDDNCDGQIDEDVPGVGEVCEVPGCGPGRRACVNGEMICEPLATSGSEEICDGLDNNCDGQIDESDPRLGQPCGSDVGVCRAGVLHCISGQLLCLGGTPSGPEVCDGLDNNCDGQIDEADELRGGRPCPQPGEPCEQNRDCATGLCLSDSGTRYCSASCERPGVAGAEGGCPAGLTCTQRAGMTVCLKSFPPCQSDRDCGEGEGCQLLPSQDPNQFGGQCRPRFVDGLANGARCGSDIAERCASGMCIAGAQVCSSLCQGPAECPESQVCVATPFSLGNGEQLNLGLCLNRCSRDDQCPQAPQQLCQYTSQADHAAVVGYCDQPYPGAAVGAPCNYQAQPALTCAHGFCETVGTQNPYCTQGCESDGDCLPDWRCLQRPYGREGLMVGWCQRPPL